ncbi:MAG: hypothetical protein JO117_04000, partial [Verrucomicrobia bacterium]|nr:hypothetical protein [Verrucomicrobiota bacterium]
VGLAIAIPTLVAFTYFNKRVEMYSVELESLLADLITKCYDVRSARRSALAPQQSTPADYEEADDEIPARTAATKLSRPRVEPA